MSRINRLLMIGLTVICYGAITAASADQVKLPRGTPLRFRILSEVRSDKNHKGDILKFQLEEGFTTWSGQLLISKSSLATGIIKKCRKAGYLGVVGQLTIEITEIQAVDATLVSIQKEFHIHTSLSDTTYVGSNSSSGMPNMPLQKGSEVIATDGQVFTALLPKDVTIDPDKNPYKSKVRENPEFYPSDVDDLALALKSKIDQNQEVASRVSAASIAVLPFDLSGITVRSASRGLLEDLSTALVKMRYRLVERAQIEAVVKELSLQHCGTVDPDTASRIGKLTGADLLILGGISDRGKLIVVNARIVETRTANCLAAVRKEIPYSAGDRINTETGESDTAANVETRK